MEIVTDSYEADKAIAIRLRKSFDDLNRLLAEATRVGLKVDVSAHCDPKGETKIDIHSILRPL